MLRSAGRRYGASQLGCKGLFWFLALCLWSSVLLVFSLVFLSVSLLLDLLVVGFFVVGLVLFGLAFSLGLAFLVLLFWLRLPLLGPIWHRALSELA